MSGWLPEIPTAGTVTLPPDPRALRALGRNHSLESALADLVDNSVDAAVGPDTPVEVLIRIVRQSGRLRSLYVVDNGRGITLDKIDTAMTVGGGRVYGETDLGLFGLGLKAASFSQARVLSVLSRAVGQNPVGRQWRLDTATTDFRCNVVPDEIAAVEVDRDWGLTPTGSGTVVRWDDVRAFPANDSPDLVEEFLTRRISSIHGHLGLMFHRLLTSDRLRIFVDEENVDTGVVGVRTEPVPLDPFAYLKSGRTGWPRDLVADLNGTKIVLRCHIWPGRSNQPQFRLPGGAEDHQGLYFYRHDRLLHAGGWDSVHAADKKLQLARVAIDIDGDISGLFTLNPEKSRVIVGPDFGMAVAQARAADDTTINDYLRTAEQTYTESQQRTRTRTAVVPPGRGMDPKVRNEIRDEIPLTSNDELKILWKPFVTDDLFEVDRDNSTLWLNQAYRRALLGGRRGGLNDAPVLKSLMFLLVQAVFQGYHLGARDRDNLEMWQEILTTAARVERSTYEERA